MIVVQLFGSPRIVIDDQPVSLPRRRSRALLYYLAAHTRPVSREQVLSLLWPDHERGAAQQMLRSTLYAIRRVLREGLVTDEESLALEAVVDVRHLQTLVAAAQVDAAMLLNALPTGDVEFLAGFALPDCEPFQLWLESERERTRALLTRSWLQLSRLYEQQGDMVAALAALDHVLRIDPLLEDVQRDAIRLAYLSGDQVGAIRRFERLRDLLDQELGVPPLRETQALYDAIITDSLATSPTVPIRLRPSLTNSSLPFVSRELEMATLQSEARPGRLVLIEGVPSIGKTRLAEEFLVRRGGLVIIGAARELEQHLPYFPIRTALHTLISRPEWSILRPQLQLSPIW